MTVKWTPEGMPKGLCRAKKLHYVMTADGTYVPEEYGFGLELTIVVDDKEVS